MTKTLTDPTTLPVLAVFVDPQLSPRLNASPELIERYAEAIDGGATFPPIVVGRRGDAFVLLDGVHRLYAHKRVSPTTPIAVVVSKASPEEFFAESVRLNVAHGRALSLPERHAAVRRLASSGYEAPAIAKLVAMPVDMVTRLTVAQVTRPAPASVAHPVTRGASSSFRHASTATAVAPAPARPLTMDALLTALGTAIERLPLRPLNSEETRAWVRRLRHYAEEIEGMMTRQLRRAGLRS